MNDLDRLRTGLEHLATEVRPVDLHTRVLPTSRRLGRQRAAGAVAAALAVAAVTSALVIGAHRAVPPPGPPATPSPTVLPSYVSIGPPGSGLLPTFTVTVPSWGSGTETGVCPTGQVKITDGQYRGGPGTLP